MKTGVVFDIREFTLHDGPGIRTTVFMQGCHMRCKWCHNPEGLSLHLQKMTRPDGSEYIKGQKYSSEELAGILNGQISILRESNGGITFSGGEPLVQAPFIVETISLLGPVHILIDTSGYGSRADFDSLLRKANLVYFDLKLAAGEEHRKWTGKDNNLILENLRTLGASRIPYVIRIPLVPGVTDTECNLAELARIIQNLSNKPQDIHLLPYNRAAGGKYKACSMEFNPGYNELAPVNINTGIFSYHNVVCTVL